MKKIKASRETTFVHHLSFLSSFESLLFLLSRFPLQATKTCGLDQLGLSHFIYFFPFLVLFSHTARCLTSGAIYHNVWLALLSSAGRINRKRMELALLDHGRVRVLVREHERHKWHLLKDWLDQKRGKCLQIVGFHLETVAMHLHRGPIHVFIVQAVVEFSNLPLSLASLKLCLTCSSFVVVCFTSGCTRHHTR